MWRTRANKSQDSHNLTVLDGVRKVFHNLWIQCRSYVSEIGSDMIEHFLIVVEIGSNQANSSRIKGIKLMRILKAIPEDKKKPLSSLNFLRACQRRPKLLRIFLSRLNLIE